jgi:hypothetical protein
MYVFCFTRFLLIIVISVNEIIIIIVIIVACMPVATLSQK